jgi:hypothetical protein
MICRIPLLDFSHVKALRGMFRIYWGRKLVRDASLQRDPLAAVQEAIRTTDDLEEVRDFLTNLEWVYLVDGIEGENPVAMNPDMYAQILAIAESPAPDPSRTAPHLLETVTFVSAGRERVLAALRLAQSADDEEYTAPGPTIDGALALPKGTLLN